MRRVIVVIAAAIALAGALRASSSLLRAAGQGGRVSEYELKAAVLYNFFRFVEWPPESFSSGTSPFEICIVGDDPFGDILPDTLQGKQVDAHGFTITRLHNDDSAAACHLAFISASEHGRLADILKPLETTPTLTVGDFDEFGAGGGMITLFTEGDRVRFSIDEASARRAGLRVSSLLLNLARPIANGKER